MTQQLQRPTRLDLALLEYDTYIETLRKQHVYHGLTGEIYYLPTKDAYGRERFNDDPARGGKIKHLRNLVNFEIKMLGKGCAIDPLPEKLQPFDLMLQKLTVVTRKVYAFADDDLLYDYVIDGAEHDCLNTYQSSGLVTEPKYTKDAEVLPWLNHIKSIFSEVDAEIILDWLAWVVQNPKDKVRWAPLIVSSQGVGKDTMLAPLHKIFGPNNVEEVYPQTLESQFNAYDLKKVLVLNEMQNSTRYNTYEKLKPKISGTGSGMVYINNKHEKMVYAKNVSAWMVFTNHGDAMPMDEGDRRFYVARARHAVEPFTEDAALYFAAMYNFYEKEDGYQKVFGWLSSRDVSAFNPNQPPACSQAKRDMMEAAMTEQGRWVASECQVGRFRHRDIILAKELEDLASDEGLERLTTRKVTEGARFAGFKVLGSHPIEGGADVHTKKTTWYARKNLTDKLGDDFCDDYREALLDELPLASRNKYFKGIKKKPSLSVIGD